MRFASLDQDYWELRNAEEWHANNPNTFWIPNEDDRRGLKIGDEAKLIFDIVYELADGSLEVGGERMVVVVREIHDDGYIGFLMHEPVSVKPSENFHLCFGAEIPFGPEHVIDISQPPDNMVGVILSMKPGRVWPRD